MKDNSFLPVMKTVTWIYFAAIAILCITIPIMIHWYDILVMQAHPRMLRLSNVDFVINYRRALYCVPLPLLWYAIRGGDAGHVHIVVAASFTLLIALVCLIILILTLPFLPLSAFVDFGE